MRAASDVLGLGIDAFTASAEQFANNSIYWIRGSSGTSNDPEARLVYLRTANGSLALCWRIETQLTENWLLSYVDVTDMNKVHGVVDYVRELASYHV